MFKILWRGIKKYIKEIVLVLIGFIAALILSKTTKEEDILSEVGNAIDTIEANSAEEADEIKRKLDMIKEISDKRERMKRLLKLKEEIDQL